jgi:hypothetical protein
VLGIGKCNWDIGDLLYYILINKFKTTHKSVFQAYQHKFRWPCHCPSRAPHESNIITALKLNIPSKCESEKRKSPSPSISYKITCPTITPPKAVNLAKSPNQT